ncbi:hypothetical protein ACSFA0_23390 [Variovorax sp. LT1P1]|uniref:hypothetical protein n=1 Tax=Variovorax sp. LT1P1 TaxID=3443730 RepID=UPI003F47FF7F
MSSTSPVSSDDSQSTAAAGAPYSHIGQLDPRFSARLTCHKCGTCQAGQVLRAGSDFFDCLECGSFTYVKGINKNAHREAARLAAPAPAEDPLLSGRFVFVCRTWGESDSPITELALDFDGVGAFMVSCWLGEPDAVDHDGTPTLPRLMDEWKAYDWTKTPMWSAEFEIGGVSAERVALPLLVASAAAPEPLYRRAGVADLILHLQQWQVAPTGQPSTHAWDRLQATIDALATPDASQLALEAARLVVNQEAVTQQTTMPGASEAPVPAALTAAIAFIASYDPDEAGRMGRDQLAQRYVSIVERARRALATGGAASAEWGANPDGIVPGQDSPIRVRTDTGAWEDHGAPVSADPAVRPGCKQPWRGFCSCGESVAAQAGPIKFKTLLTGGKFCFKVGGPVFVREKSFFRTLPDGDNGRSFPADMDATVYPVPDTAAASTPVINCDICGFPTQGAARHPHCSNVD